MKVDFLRKAKWYIVGFILAAIMLSVSLSFCTWDTLSAKASMSANGGNFKEKPDTKYILVTDNNANEIADVGDIVTFGNYYQDKNNTVKSAIRWIVVEKDGTNLTLLAEKVMAFGSFWGTYYHNGSSWVYGTQANGSYYQNYSQSTVRAWLNSSNTRNDGGPAISSSSTQGVQFRGFMSEAFTADEQAYILSKTISGMKGAGKDNNPSSSQSYETVTDKVWLPSYIEMYSNTGITWGVGSDNLSDKQFSYFANNSTPANKIGYTTAFASSQYSNYTWTNATSAVNYQSSLEGGRVWWWLRSPDPSHYSVALRVNIDGVSGTTDTYYSYGGVRPAVCVPL